MRFIKRSTGETREMRCRRHVHVGVKGILPPGQREAEDALHACITVYEMLPNGPNGPNRPDGAGGAFKRIPLNAILEIKAAGESVLPG